MRFYLAALFWVSSVLPLYGAQIIQTEPVKVIDRYDRGVLIDAAGTKALLLAGTHYQMGYQQGKLMQGHIKSLTQKILDLARLAEMSGTDGYTTGSLKQAWYRTRKFIDYRFIEEMQGIADGAGVDFNDVCLANTFPELFHCSGFALFGDATNQGKLLHGRILDYMTQAGLQQFAVVIIAKPDNYNAFVNVGYTGLIGSVTGMNEKLISIGEMGGSGKGEWDGMPMVFLLRKALEESASLNEAVSIFKNSRRTCEYYYVVSDAKIPDARGLACTGSTFEIVEPNVPHPKLPYAIKDAVLMSAGDRYEALAAGVEKQFGKIDINAALDLMNRPVAMKSCLHRVLFSPKDMNFWVANAAVDINDPNFAACYQPYYQYDFARLLKLIPAADSNQQTIPTSPKQKIVFGDEMPVKANEPNVIQNIELKTVPACEDKILPSANEHQQSLLNLYPTDGNEFSYRMTLRADSNSYQIFDVEFPSPCPGKTAASNTIYCEYYKCKSDTQRSAVVVLDILAGSMVVSRLIAGSLAAGGCDACIMTLPHCGKRRSADPNQSIKINQSAEIFIAASQQAVADIRRTVRWLKFQPHIDDNRIGICGTSLGGIVAAIACGVDSSFPRAAIIIAGGDLSTIMTTDAGEVKSIKTLLESQGISRRQLEKMLEPIEPLSFADRIRSTKLIMFNASQDTVIPPACAQKLADAAGAEIIWYPTDHYGMAMSLMAVMQKLNGHFCVEQW